MAYLKPFIRSIRLKTAPYVIVLGPLADAAHSATFIPYGLWLRFTDKLMLSKSPVCPAGGCEQCGRRPFYQ